jgi:putative sterol carrier protein
VTAVAEFLSDEWLASMNRAAAGSEDLRRATARTRLTVQQVVRGGDEERCYVVRVDHGRVAVEAGRDPGADITITEDAETAAAVARGELSPQIAFMLGRIRVTGDMPALMASYEALAGVEDVFAPVRAATSYGS